MVRFLPFDRTDEEGVHMVLQNIDFSIQYGEDLEFKEPKVSSEGLSGSRVGWSLRPRPELQRKLSSGTAGGEEIKVNFQNKMCLFIPGINNIV